MKNKTELYELLDNLKLDKDNVKKNGEVFTPIFFIKIMYKEINKYYKYKYEKSIFENEKFKWLDPAAGIGNYFVVLLFMLMKGLKHKIPDKKQRKKHIIEKMFYMIEINKNNTKQIKQNFKNYNINLYEGNALDVNIKKTFNVNKFDVIIGNPPYNKKFHSSKSAFPLYNEFIKYYIDKCNLLYFIIPDKWMGFNRELTAFKNFIIKRNDIVYINQYDSKNIFSKKLTIGKIITFLKDSNHNNYCLLNGIKNKLNKYNVIVDKKYYKLIDKLDKYPKLSSLYICMNPYNIESNDKRLVNKAINNNYIKCYAKKCMNNGIMYINKDDIKKNINYDYYKVIITRICSRFKPIILNKNEIDSRTYFEFRVNNLTEAESLKSYLDCDLPNIILNAIKYSVHINTSMLNYIPIPPLDRLWNNNLINDYFRINNIIKKL